MAKLTKQEYKILMEAQIDLTGYDNIKKVIEGTKSSKEAIQKLAEFTGMLKGMADTISKISKSGFKADLQSIAKTINQSMATFNSMPSLDNIQNVADPKKFATGRTAKRRFTQNPGQVAAFGAVAQAKMIEVGGVVNETNAKLLLNLQKQLNAEKERTYKLTKVTTDVLTKETDELEKQLKLEKERITEEMNSLLSGGKKYNLFGDEIDRETKEKRLLDAEARVIETNKGNGNYLLVGQEGAKNTLNASTKQVKLLINEEAKELAIIEKKLKLQEKEILNSKTLEELSEAEYKLKDLLIERMRSLEKLGLYKTKLGMMPDDSIQKQEAMERKRLAKDEADADIAEYKAHKASVKAAQKEHAAQVRREQEEKIKAEQRAAKDAEKLALRTEKERLRAAQQAEKERQRLIKERERAEKKAQREVDEMNRKSEAERIRAEKKVSQEKERLRKADEKAKAKQEREEEERRKKSFGGRIKEFFSMEKLVSRMSFVITAKLSYDLFNIISRLPGQILRTWREFQAEISKTFALLANETKLTKDRLTNDVINLSKTYGIAAKEISTALYEVISAQVGVADASKVLEEAIKLSMSGGGDITTAAHSLVQLMNAYDIAFSQAGRVSDIAFQTVKYGQLTLQQYTDQMSKVVATASILKIPLEEISAAIATMTINGINADQAFTALNQMLMTIANPTEKSKKLLSELGYNLSIGEVQAKGLGGALSELIPMLNMTGSANEELITILFKNRTGFKAVASLLQNMPDYYQNYIRMIDSAGAAEEGLAERTNTVDFQMNRLKTTWEALMMSFMSGNDQSIISFYKNLSNTLDSLSKNISTIFTVLKSIGIIIAGIALHKLLVQLSILVKHLKSLPLILTNIKNGVITTGTAMKTMLSSSMALISIFITLLSEVVLWFGHIAKKAKEASIDKLMGIRRAGGYVEELENKLSSLDSKIGQLEGIKKFISQWEELNNAQKKNANQKGAIESMYNSIVGVMRNAGIALDSTKTKAEQMAQAMVDVTNKIRQLSSESAATGHLISVAESRRDLSEVLKDSSPGWLENILSVTQRMGYKEIEFQAEDAAKTAKNVETALAKGFTKANEAEIKRVAQNAITFVTGNISVIEKELKKSWPRDIAQNMENLKIVLLNQKKIYQDIMNTNLDIQMARYDGIDVPKTVVDTSGGGGGKPSEVSFMPELTRIFESFFGEDIYEDVAEIRNVLIKQLNDVKDNIDKAVKDGSIVTDEAEARSEIRSLRLLLEDNLFIQLFEEGKNAVARVMENAKKLKDSGDIDGAKAEYDKAFKIYQEYSNEVEKWFGQDEIVKLGEELYNNIGQKTGKVYDIRSGRLKNLSYDDAKEYGWTGTEDQYKQFVSLSDDAIVLIKTGMQRFWQNARTALIEMNSTLIDGAKGALSDDDFINLALTSFGINADVTSNWDALTKAIEDAEKEGFVAKTEFLKFIADNTMTAYKDFLTEMFDLDQPEYVKEAISAIKSKIDNDKIVDKNVIQELIEKVIEKLLSLGKNVSQEDKDAITEGVMPDTEAEIKKGFDWKSVVGIADYENDNEAILDISKQAVSQLQAVWSFYWDWEIRQLQKQHDKKLQLLEDEKSIMLANENMSSQQRAIIEERFEEKKRAMQERMDKEMAAKKKKQAIFNASIDFAKGLIGIWSSELSKGIFGLSTAPILSGLLAGIFATQLALINNQKFAKGGYTGSGVGSPDETGYRPAGIVHEGELVIDKKTLDRGNLNPLMSIYQAMKSGQSFDAAAANYLMGNLQTKMPRPINSGMFAGGGYVGKNKSMLQSQEITIDFKGMKVLDPVELNRLVIDVGGKKRRKIGE